MYLQFNGRIGIKEFGIEASKAIEEFIGKQVQWELQVKVREKWREKEGWVRNWYFPEKCVCR